MEAIATALLSDGHGGRWRGGRLVFLRLVSLVVLILVMVLWGPALVLVTPIKERVLDSGQLLDLIVIPGGGSGVIGSMLIGGLRAAGGVVFADLTGGDQVWSLTQFYSPDFLQSRM